jgi:hypothetical protein
MTQWHPLFAKMLRPLVQDHYDVQTGVPVGDAPRLADIVLVRRRKDRPAPFRGVLHHLATWNILEFKGRTVSPRLGDLDLLIELGLGVDRRWNAERVRRRKPPVDAAEVTFWYIANHLGQRFLSHARELLRGLEEASPGVWRSQVLRRPLFLVDGTAVPVERDSVAIHLAGEESPAIEQALARVIVEEPGFWELYGPLLGALHPNVFEEANRMAKSRGKRGDLDLRPFVEKVGLKKYLAAVEPGDFVATFGLKKVIESVSVEELMASLPEKVRRELKHRLR